MADAKVSTYLPPSSNPTQAAIAYGCRALPKLDEELRSDDLLTRQKALLALCDLMHDPEHVYTAISIGCLESLKALLKDTDDLVRIKTTEVLRVMATHSVGREGFLEHNVIQALSFLLSDPQPACRENLYTAFKHLAQVPAENCRAQRTVRPALEGPGSDFLEELWQHALPPEPCEGAPGGPCRAHTGSSGCWRACGLHLCLPGDESPVNTLF